MKTIYFILLSICFCSFATAQELRTNFSEENQTHGGDVLLKFLQRLTRRTFSKAYMLYKFQLEVKQPHIKLKFKTCYYMREN